MTDDILMTLPFWILGIGGVVLMLLEAFLKSWPRTFFTSLILLITIFAAIKTGGAYVPGRTAFAGTVAVDQFALFFTVLISIGTLFVVFLGSDSLGRSGVESHGEFYALLLMSTAGAVLFANSAELITMFLGLEIMSMALYCLCGSALTRKDSTESAMKYFLLGSFSSAFLLYGIAILYGLTGSMYIAEIAQKLPSVSGTMLAIGVGMMIVGLAFKIGLVPFHFWVPDVYQGAPTIISVFMACVIKASAIGAAMRVLWIIMPDLLPLWSGVVWLLAILTIVIGNLLALRQQNIKRMLAYSSVAHAGYIMSAFLAPSSQFGGGPAILFYIITYSAMTFGAFGVLLALSDGKGGASEDLSSFNGMGFKKPFLGALMAIFMLSLAGLPPGLAGLLGKFYVFSAVIKSGYVGLAIVAMCASTVSCYYYLRVIVAMYFKEAGTEKIIPKNSLRDGALAFCGAACVLLGLFPSLLYSYGNSLSQLLR